METENGYLNPDLARMVKVGKDYDIVMDGIAVSREIQRKMPIWYHNNSTETALSTVQN
jgi:hypothetical protein